MLHVALCHVGIVIWLLGLVSRLCSSSAPVGYNRTTAGPCFHAQSYDGSYSELCLHFSKGLQIWRSIALGEVDLGHLPFYSLCFISTLDKDEMKLKDAFLKLDKKLSSQEASLSDVDKKTVHLEWVLDLQTTKKGLGRLGAYCSNADVAYMTKRVVDKIIIDESIVNTKLLTAAIESLPVSNESTYPYCEDARHVWELGCICKRNICIAGVPCAPLQCSGRENYADNCVMKTCTKCTSFQYYVPNKKTCFWNMKGSSSYQ